MVMVLLQNVLLMYWQGDDIVEKEQNKDTILEIRRLQKENAELNKRLKKVEEAVYRYRKSPYDTCYRFLGKIKRYIKRVGNRCIECWKKRKKHILPTVTVVIPTYKQNPYIEQCINSVLSQDYNPKKLEIIVSVNGEDKEYFHYLEDKYKDIQRIQVIHTPKQGAGSARNYAKSYIRTDYVTYLDDDDYLTSGFIKTLAQFSFRNVSVICGKMAELCPDETLNYDTYINAALDKVSDGKHHEYLSFSSCFSTLCCKLYKTSLIRDVLSDINENVMHTEDVLFWVENIYKIPDYIYTYSHTEEAYIRRVTSDSLSRPNVSAEYNFFITDRITLIEMYTKEIFQNNRDMDYKRFVLGKIDATVQIMYRYFDELTLSLKEKARKQIFASESVFMNKSKFGQEQGIAFCHNFPPTVDASAYVASKRLSQISDYWGEIINWTVVTSNLAKQKKQDSVWEMFFAKYQYTEKIITEGKTWFNEFAQESWGKNAYELVSDREVKYIYSRSMWAGSHVAALLYKKEHPTVKWIAEFSDPLFMGTDNQPRPSSKEYEDELAYLNTFWRDLENSVFENADKIIFTNDNQLTYMLECNPPKDIDAVKGKGLVWNHPIVSNVYASIFESNIELDHTKINIAYFGTFYQNRNVGAMLDLLQNPIIHLHLFTNITDELKDLKKKYTNLFLHPMVSQLEFLNLAHRMDYCFLNDIEFDGEINPYLPSKVADYLAADVPVIALVRPNTPMDKLKYPQLIKINELSADFINTLVKRAES